MWINYHFNYQNVISFLIIVLYKNSFYNTSLLLQVNNLVAFFVGHTVVEVQVKYHFKSCIDKDTHPHVRVTNLYGVQSHGQTLTHLHCFVVAIWYY